MPSNRHDGRCGGLGTGVIPSYPILFALVGLPYLLYILRARTIIVILLVLFYVIVVLPAALKGQMPYGSFNWLPKASASCCKIVLVGIKECAEVLLPFLASSTRCLCDALCWVIASSMMLPVFVCEVMFESVLAINSLYISSKGLRVTTNQMVFFLMAERLMIDHQNLMFLRVLLLYMVLAYIYHSLSTHSWSQGLYGQRSLTSMVGSYVSLRLGKSVVLAFIIIIFSAEKFNDREEPNLVLFVTLTFIYFVFTQHEWTGQEFFVGWIQFLGLPFFNGDEEFIIPLTLRILPVLASATLAVHLGQLYPVLFCISIYVNISVPLLQLNTSHQSEVSRPCSGIISYKPATAKDLQDHSQCPVCLDEMQYAVVTPCNHVFHTACIRKCLTVSNLCPLCKRDIRLE
ncbi:unnamed protein product, partial [Meganyctiphanes norvegica]|uniref:RING-type domain-containing protein n=1 Tax=Meganyctiphanes norvegica TaxID=48144 RepID=A0AAV2RDL6_MEGNR